jgi:hypothetical protein
MKKVHHRFPEAVPQAEVSGTSIIRAVMLAPATMPIADEGSA